MNLGTYFINNKPREIAGSRTSDKYTYQQEWALNKIIGLFEENKDFALIMEYHEDAIIFNNSTIPTHVDMFQIKTNENKRQATMTPTVLLEKKKIKGSKPIRYEPSFLEKLFYNFSLFEDYDKKIYFISNKLFNFTKSNIDSETNNPIYLHQLSSEDFNDISKQICNVCKKTSCKQECKECIAFEKSNLQVETSYDQLFTKLQTFISKYSDVTYSDSKAIYNTLMAQIKDINDSREKYKCNDFDELIKKYSISRTNLTEFLAEISYEQSFTKKWQEINTILVSEEYNVREIKKIKTSCKEFVVETFNDFDGILDTLIKLIDIELKIVDADALKDIIHIVLEKIKINLDSSMLLYEDDFYQGAIIMRWFNE
jgi:hypothetical protein